MIEFHVVILSAQIEALWAAQSLIVAGRQNQGAAEANEEDQPGPGTSNGAGHQNGKTVMEEISDSLSSDSDGNGGDPNDRIIRAYQRVEDRGLPCKFSGFASCNCCADI